MSEYPIALPLHVPLNQNQNTFCRKQTGNNAIGIMVKLELYLNGTCNILEFSFSCKIHLFEGIHSLKKNNEENLAVKYCKIS